MDPKPVIPSYRILLGFRALVTIEHLVTFLRDDRVHIEDVS
jgi:hypothetical protein